MEFVLIVCLFIILTCAMFPRVELFSSLPFNVYIPNSKSVNLVVDDIVPEFSTEVSYYERTNQEFQSIMDTLVNKKETIQAHTGFVRHNAKYLELKYIDAMKRRILTHTSLGKEGYVIVYVNVKDLLKNSNGDMIVVGVFCIYKQGKIVGKDVSFEFINSNGKEDDISFLLLKVNGNVTEDVIHLKPYDTINHSFGSSSLSSSLIE